MPHSPDASGPSGPVPAPPEIGEYAEQAVEYVRRAVGITMEYNSDTLPLLDHYLRSVPAEKAAAAHLVAATAGAYFGEVIRRQVGGHWDLGSSDPGSWRLLLPSGVWFFPAAMALAAILGPDTEDTAESADLDDTDPEHTDVMAGDWDASLMAPAALRGQVAGVLESMAEVSPEEYYSLCCRYDTIEHLQDVLAASAAQARGGDADADA